MHFGAIQDVLGPVLKNKLSVCGRRQRDRVNSSIALNQLSPVKWATSSRLAGCKYMNHYESTLFGLDSTLVLLGQVVVVVRRHT